MSKARGKLQTFEPANVAGIDTRIWQGKGSASDINGVEFSLRGEIVKAFGYQRLLEWKRVVSKKRTTDKGKAVDPRAPSEDNPLGGSEVLTLGTFTWGGSTELIVAYWTTPVEVVKLIPQTLQGKVTVAVLETNDLREIYSYYVGKTRPRPNKYPRLTDVGPYMLITVEGMQPRKWDGRILSMAGVQDVPEPIQVAAIVGTGDTQANPTDKPTQVGDFWESHSFDQDDATAATLEYYQTFLNMYGQESNLSAVSNELVLNDYLGVDAKESFSPMSLSELLAPSLPTMHNVQVTTEGSYSTNGVAGDPTIPNVTRNITKKGLRLVAFLDLGDPPPQIDIVQRLIYRSIGGQTPTSLPRRLGVASNTHFDIRRIATSSATPAPAPGENDPPPPARWSFTFRGRVYYRGDNSLLHYSKLNFPEAVSVTNFIEINTNDGDEITGWGAAQDYAIVFKRKSAYLLTHDKNEDPVITPLQSTFGAITDRAVISFDNNTYFLSDVGFHLFDGSSFKRLSSVLDEKVKQLPKHTREAATVFADRQNNRVYISVNGNPGIENNEVWVIHTDNGSFSIIDDRSVVAAIPYKDEVVIASNTDSDGNANLFLWGTGYDLDGTGFTGSYSTEWLELKNPHSDKRFYKLLMYFVQTGNIEMTVSWYADWDDRTAVGSETFTLDEAETVYWGKTDVTWSTSAKWDERRLVSKFVDLKETSGSAAQTITAKAMRFKFETNDANTPFRLVGWQVVADDYGERAEGTAKR
jgi:hypothetical protein